MVVGLALGSSLAAHPDVWYRAGMFSCVSRNHKELTCKYLFNFEMGTQAQWGLWGEGLVTRLGPRPQSDWDILQECERI